MKGQLGATGTYDCTGAPVTLPLPPGVPVLHVDAMGAAGGTPGGIASGDGGGGAEVKATINVALARQFLGPASSLLLYTGCSGGTEGGFGYGHGGNPGSGSGGRDGNGGGGGSAVLWQSSQPAALVVAGGGGGGGGESATGLCPAGKGGSAGVPGARAAPGTEALVAGRAVRADPVATTHSRSDSTAPARTPIAVTAAPVEAAAAGTAVEAAKPEQAGPSAPRAAAGGRDVVRRRQPVRTGRQWGADLLVNEVTYHGLAPDVNDGQGQLTRNYTLGSRTSVTSSQSPSVGGEAVHFVAAVAPFVGHGNTPTGTVQFSVDGVNLGGPVGVSGGVAVSSATPLLSVGQHTVTANYSGDDSYGASSGSFTQTVEPLMSAASRAPQGQVGQPYRFTPELGNGTAPYHWSVLQGNLPSGLSLNPSTGSITGTPSQPGPRRSRSGSPIRANRAGRAFQPTCSRWATARFHRRRRPGQLRAPSSWSCHSAR